MNDVLISDLKTANGCMLGHAHLNVEATLNSLSLDMARRLHGALTDWSGRDEVVAVVITGAGDKAFCAGGDIQALYRAIDANHAANAVVDDYPFRFFEAEYRLDFAIHNFHKPLLALGHGIVMGGGLGIFSAARYRVLTQKSRLASPEITIGLFPDAGASWTYRNMPQHWASFLGLSGAQLNAADALLVGIGTHVVDHDRRHVILDEALSLPWQANASDVDLVDEWLATLATPAMPEAQISAVPERVPDFEDFAGEISAVQNLQGLSDWVDKGIGNLNSGCPTTAGIIVEQLRRVPHMTLADTYRMELTLATHCAQNLDFREGVRALLIDKDNTPNWQFGSLDRLDWNHVLTHFVDPWPNHPLADLE